VTAALWDFTAVRSGVATLSAPVAEAFVPQMLNYESVGGVNFKKGCYPGQEVVARSQFRGAIKRRAYVAHVDGQAQAGQEVFASDAPEQPCGLIAQAAPAPGGGTAVIASVQLVAQESGAPLHVGAADGPRLSQLHRPYALIEV
jgi:folate-binding protein YgfZ